MDTAGFVAHMERDGTLLAVAATAADWDAPVPGTTWSVRDLVLHVGGVHRWSADIVRRRLTSDETGGSASWRPELPDDEVLDWYADGLTALVTTLTQTPADVEVWAFGRPAPAAAFWARRQAHETAVHRADVQTAAGREVTDFDAQFAQDGLRELCGFARGFPGGSTGRLAWLADDGDDWLVTFEGRRVAGAPTTDPADADATVRGTSSDLYRWAWNRPSPATVEGDPAVVELWRRVRIT